MDGVRRLIILSYFSITTLSTVGFGDFYPVSDVERATASLFLLFAIILFSFFMGKLNSMIEKQLFNEDSYHDS